MPKPKLFIGSSQKNIAIAEAFKNNLDDFIEVQIWDQDVFVNNQSFLESLLTSLNAFDYALFIYATDDTILKKDKPGYSPRDNVVFESGLFMGSLGRHRVFVAYDEANDLKIPTDFAGISLFSYDSKMMKRNRAAAVNKACIGIKAEIKKQTERYPYLKGKWRSKYKIPFMEEMPVTTEEIKISAYREGVLFESVKNSLKDYYTAYWKSKRGK